MNYWDYIWAGFLTAVMLIGAILEWLGYISGKNGTLSDTLRRWLGIDPVQHYRNMAVPLFISGVIAIVVWLSLHLISSWFPWK
jgi:Na+/H+ antiporter NhaC